MEAPYLLSTSAPLPKVSSIEGMMSKKTGSQLGERWGTSVQNLEANYDYADVKNSSLKDEGGDN